MGLDDPQLVARRNTREIAAYQPRKTSRRIPKRRPRQMLPKATRNRPRVLINRILDAISLGHRCVEEINDYLGFTTYNQRCSIKSGLTRLKRYGEIIQLDADKRYYQPHELILDHLYETDPSIRPRSG